VFPSDLRYSPGLVMAGQRLRVLFPSRPDWVLPLLFPLSPGPPRLDLPVETLLLAVPVLRSVLRLMCAPMYPLSVLPRRAAASLLVILRDTLFAPLCLYPPMWLLGIYRTRHLCRSSSPCEPGRVWGCGCCCAAGY
jgi:hypothetical protein